MLQDKLELDFVGPKLTANVTQLAGSTSSSARLVRSAFWSLNFGQLLSFGAQSKFNFINKAKQTELN